MREQVFCLFGPAEHVGHVGRDERVKGLFERLFYRLHPVHSVRPVDSVQVLKLLGTVYSDIVKGADLFGLRARVRRQLLRDLFGVGYHFAGEDLLGCSGL